MRELLAKKILIFLTVLIVFGMVGTSCATFKRTPRLYYECNTSKGSNVTRKSNDGTIRICPDDNKAIRNLSILLQEGYEEGELLYRVNLRKAGWQEWRKGPEYADNKDSKGKTHDIWGVEMMLTGRVSCFYDIHYRLKTEAAGWHQWVTNGAPAGSDKKKTGERVTDIEARIEPKQNVRFTPWTITQYTDDSGNQSSFYTLKNNEKGTLIVIDGGWKANAPQVRSIIKAYGGKVDYWFLTNYNKEHISAFNEIYRNPDDITIGRVYVTPLDIEFCKTNLDEFGRSSLDAYEEFLALTDDDMRIKHLRRSENMMIDGVNVEIFNAFDDVIKGMNGADIAKHSSLVIKFTGIHDSMIFFGDTYGSSLGNHFIKTYGAKIKARYVQAGHHGNNTLPNSLYESISPEVVFVDCPEKLINAKGSSAGEFIGWANESGIRTFDYRSGANSVSFD